MLTHLLAVLILYHLKKTNNFNFLFFPKNQNDKLLLTIKLLRSIPIL